MLDGPYKISYKGVGRKNFKKRKINPVFNGWHPGYKVKRSPVIPSELSVKVGKMIRAARADFKITQKALGNSIGTTQSVIARIESGKNNITLKTLLSISKVLKKRIKINFE